MYNNYGVMSSERMLAVYGFVDAHAPLVDAYHRVMLEEAGLGGRCVHELNGPLLCGADGDIQLPLHGQRWGAFHCTRGRANAVLQACAAQAQLNVQADAGGDGVSADAWVAGISADAALEYAAYGERCRHLHEGSAGYLGALYCPGGLLDVVLGVLAAAAG